MDGHLFPHRFPSGCRFDSIVCDFSLFLHHFLEHKSVCFFIGLGKHFELVLNDSLMSFLFAHSPSEASFLKDKIVHLHDCTHRKQWFFLIFVIFFTTIFCMSCWCVVALILVPFWFPCAKIIMIWGECWSLCGERLRDHISRFGIVFDQIWICFQALVPHIIFLASQNARFDSPPIPQGGQGVLDQRLTFWNPRLSSEIKPLPDQVSRVLILPPGWPAHSSRPAKIQVADVIWNRFCKIFQICL